MSTSHCKSHRGFVFSAILFPSLLFCFLPPLLSSPFTSCLLSSLLFDFVYFHFILCVTYVLVTGRLVIFQNCIKFKDSDSVLMIILFSFLFVFSIISWLSTVHILHYFISSRKKETETTSGKYGLSIICNLTNK
jgi:hypothetical protein